MRRFWGSTGRAIRFDGLRLSLAYVTSAITLERQLREAQPNAYVACLDFPSRQSASFLSDQWI